VLKGFNDRLQELLAALGGAPLRGGRIGLEKESLRVAPDGTLSARAHPPALGAALTHPFITTDFSEALIELITPPYPEPDRTLAFLDELHREVYANLDGELLWATSMPCIVSGKASIPIARYGRSNVGHMKEVYRRGLALRYDPVMQLISGVHFNYSAPLALWPALGALDGHDLRDEDAVSAAYFGLTRNFLRYGWIVPYLFGSSPAICKSFFPDDVAPEFEEFDTGTWYRPHATSLRMSDIGYKNSSQQDLQISYDSLHGYVSSLTRAIETPSPAYARLGVKVGEEYRQLNANLLQIENEYYGTIRPKQIARSGEPPTLALSRRGVLYVEVRSLDVDPFQALGVSADAMRFIEALLLLCLIAPSPPLAARERRDIARNLDAVASRGREPDLRLRIEGVERPLRDCAQALCDALEPLCAGLDGAAGGPYVQTLTAQREAAEDPELTVSARILAEMRRRDESFFQFAMRCSKEHAAGFLARPLAPGARRGYDQEAERSHAQQAAVEAADRVTFDVFLERYFHQGARLREEALAKIRSRGVKMR